MEIEPLSPRLIEQYLQWRDLRFYRGHEATIFWCSSLLTSGSCT